MFKIIVEHIHRLFRTFGSFRKKSTFSNFSNFKTIKIQANDEGEMCEEYTKDF